MLWTALSRNLRDRQGECSGWPDHKLTPTMYVTKTEPKAEDPEPKQNLTKTKEKRFAPPTLENVMGYCQEMGYSIDAQRLIDFYEAKGWYIGKNKMKDWRAAVRNWNRSQRQELTAEAGKRQGMAAAPNRFHNFEQSETSYDAIMQEQLRRRLTEGENDG